jgi:NAD(P)-dependent dehydrogenase (short-subunit alcohol dehydrogenase family)
VVANAGITRDAMFHRMTPEQWKEVIDTNLTGVFNTVHPVWPGMRERKFGRVIVISSINGQKGQAGQVNYAATKAGDLGIVKSLAQEGARAGITANAICPGYIGTEMVRAIPEDVLNSKIIPQIPAGSSGRTRGNRALRGVPRLRRRGLHQRIDDFRQRGAVLRLIPIPDKRKAGASTPAFFVRLSGGSAAEHASDGFPEVAGAFGARCGDPFAHFWRLCEVFHGFASSWSLLPCA